MGRKGLLRRRGARFFAIAMAAALALAACGDDGDSSDGGTDAGSGEASGDLTDSFRGVTADSIKLGIAMVDYDAIAEFVDFYRGDQQATAQAFVDWINDNGGVGGRQIEPVYYTYPPIPGQEPSSLTLCTTLTEDDEVFAVLGAFIDFTGDAQLCLSRDNETIHIGHELEDAWINDAIPGLMLTPDLTLDAGTDALFQLLGEEGTLDGATVAVLADQDGQARVDDVIVPGLEDLGVELGSEAVLTIMDEDTSAAQAQLDAVIERWKDEGVDTIFMDGLRASADQFVIKIKAELPDVQLIANNDTVLQQARDLQAAGTDPNPYDGMISVLGETDQEQWDDQSESFAECVSVYEEATGETVLGPDEIEPDADGRILETYIAVRDFCGELLMFQQIAEAAGPDLTNESWQAAVADFGELTLPTTDFASICDGKYSADDAVRIVEYDPSIAMNGDWAPITEVIDGSGGRCTS